MMKLRYQIILSLLSGVLVCISFPTLIAGVQLPEMGPLMWIALVPLILAVRQAPPRRAFCLTFLAALVWYGGSLFWVYRAMNTYGHLPAVTSVLVLILLVVIVAAYIALAPLLARFIETRWRGELLIWLAVCWTAVEILRNFVPCNGFPWADVAMSQWRLLPLIQICDLTGVYGLIFLIVWVNAFLAEAIAKLAGETVARFVPKAIVTTLFIVATMGYGFYRLHAIPPELAENPSMSVGLVQANIGQEDKWSQGRAQANLDAHREGTKRLLEAGVELILWPEAAFPWPVEIDDTEIDPRALGFTTDGVGDFPYTLLGAISDTSDGNYYNSAILFAGDGAIAGRYHKAHLVPFGEYVPYRKLFFFAKKLTQPVGNFLAGTSVEPLSIGAAKAGILICYEDIFPEIARREVRAGAQFLVNLTNDAWYGVSSAPFQHLAISVFRAVENRRFLVRATNSGVSAIVMPTGTVMVESGIFEPSLMVSPVALLSTPSPYTSLGDWFAWGCVAYAGFGVAMVLWMKWRKRTDRKEER